MAKYCTHCGKQISDKAVFCKYCGEKADSSDAAQNVSDKKANNKIKPRKISEVETGTEGVIMKEPAKTSGKKSEDEKLPKKMIAIIVAAIALVVVVAAVGAVMYFGKTNDAVSTSDTETKESTEETTQEEAKETQDQPVESKGSGSESKSSGAESKSSNNSNYQVGETYTVQTNLRVREGPGKKYRILDRSELAPDDYAQSVDSTTTTDALMEKGSRITCLEMSGNWMRISSGWVCVEDEGEVLVK